MTRADLPELTQDMAQAFVDKAATIMRAQGWIEQRRKTVNAHDAAIDADATFSAIYGSREQKYAQKFSHPTSQRALTKTPGTRPECRDRACA